MGSEPRRVAPPRRLSLNPRDKRGPPPRGFLGRGRLHSFNTAGRHHLRMAEPTAVLATISTFGGSSCGAPGCLAPSTSS